MNLLLHIAVLAALAAEPPPVLPDTIYADATGPVAQVDPQRVDVLGGEAAIALGCAGERAGDGALDQACDGTSLVESVRAGVAEIRGRGLHPTIVWRGDRLLASGADLCGGTAAAQKVGADWIRVSCGESEPPAPPEDLSRYGSLDRALIDGVVKKDFGRLRACYQDALAKNSRLEGIVTIKFTISAEGPVSHVEVKRTTLPGTSVQECMMRIFSQMTFPPPKGGGIIKVSYPFVFNGPDR